MLREMYQFERFPIDKPYIQLLHAGCKHWVRISSIQTNKCDNGTHYIYDSLCKPKIMLDIAKTSSVLFVP